MEAKKRVLVFVPEFPVLSETFIERELSKLVERGNVDLTVFALKRGTGYISENLIPRVYYKRLGISDILGIIQYIFSNFSKVTKAYKNIGKGPHNKTFLLLKSIGYSLKFEDFHPDLILAHFLSESSTIVMIASKLLDTPFAISAHAKDVTVTHEYVKEKVEQAKFITVCNKAAYYFLQNLLEGKSFENIYLNHHGVDVSRVTKMSLQGAEKPTETLLLAAGRLTEKKGFTYLIEAANILKKRNVSFVCYIIGFGPLYKELSKQISDLELEENVKIIGDEKGISNSNEKILKAMKICDVFAFPSIETNEGDFDGVATLLIEAGVMAKPIVATDAGSTVEFILDKETGLIVPQKQPEALAVAIQTLIKDRDMAVALGENAYEKVLKDFDLDKNIVKLEELLIK